MRLQKDIPAVTGLNHDIERVTFNLTEKKAYVEIHPEGQPHKVVSVDILALFTTYASTTTQKNTIKAFFRYVIAEAMVINESTITEEIFAE